MSSIDELFQKSGIPTKRKHDPVRDPNEVYKSARVAGGAPRHAHVDVDVDMEAGPALPADDDDDNDDDYGPAPPPDEPEDLGDDDEGRFFGGGITQTEASVLDYIEGGGDASAADATGEAPAYDAAWLRKTALAFERRINRNAELRARHETEPAKFIGSEADLDAAIKALSIVGEHPELYPELARLGTAASLVGLLAHDNTDIAIAALTVLDELTDEDVAGADDAQWAALVDALLAADLAGLLTSNLARLNEDPAADPDGVDRTGVYHALGIVENLCSLRTTRAPAELGASRPLLAWLLQRVRQSESEPAAADDVTQNKQYAAEVLALLAQSVPATSVRLVRMDAIDTMLQLVAAYRRRDPAKGSYEEEYMLNLFEALTYLVGAQNSKETEETEETTLPVGQAAFLAAEGVELCLILVKDGKKSRAPALRLLDHATSGRLAAPVCVRVVEAGGLKPLFTLFVKGEKKKDKKERRERLQAGPTAEALLNIFSALLRLLPADADERIRLLAKFVERDYEKVRQLVALRAEYGARATAVDAQMDATGRGPKYAATLADGDPDKDAIEVERMSRQLDAGLYELQTVDVILAWLVAEDGGARTAVQTLLPECDAQFGLLRASLEGRRAELDTALPEGRTMDEMLAALLEAL